MTQFLQQLVNGTATGAMYGLIALGYTMVYGIIQLINFAHGEVFMIGAYGGYTMYHYILPSDTPTAMALVAVLLAAMASSVIVAVLMERFAYRPLRGANRLAPLITAIGVSLFLQQAVYLWYPDGSDPKPFPQFFSNGSVHLGGVQISYVRLFVVVMAVVLMVALRLFVFRSQTGRAMRATAQDPDTARLMGIDTNRIIVITFIIGAALAGSAGVAQGMQFSPIDPLIGFQAGLKAFTAAVLGGIGNITGAMLGGFVLGIVEALATQYLPQGSAYKDVWAYLVLIAVLIFRPSGLLGESVRARA